MRIISWSSAVSLCCLMSAGCAAPNESCCGQPVVARDDIPRDVTVLADDLSSLKASFNAESSRWRVFSLVSPTCSECVLGAEAVEREITRRYPADQVSALVVWIPMLDSDNETGARASATIFPPARAAHFYDSKQTVGWAFARGVFSEFIDRAIKATPNDHYLAEMLRDPAETDRPQWDLYMLFAPGVRWESENPPMPTHWVRHCGRMDGKTSTYWRDSPDAGPLEGDLFAAIREMADDAIGKPARGSAASSMKIELLGFEGCPNTPLLRSSVQKALDEMKSPTKIIYIDQLKLNADDLRRGWPTPTVLVNGRDLFGLAPPLDATLRCRTFARGVPDAGAIADKLSALR